jgi:hypothetical protein
MTGESPESQTAALQRERALARWDNEGGAMASGSQGEREPADQPMSMPAVTAFELMTLHCRVIALENLVTSLLATATEHQLALAREMAAFIMPRDRFTQHSLTIHAAAHMINLVERAERFRDCKTA